MTNPHIEELIAQGAIPEKDAEQIRRFADFLELGGPPGSGDVGKRLIAAGRLDLLKWAMGEWE